MQSTNSHLQINTNKHETKSNTNSVSTGTANPNNNSKFTIETLETDKITITPPPTHEALYHKIYSIQPQLAGKITTMFINNINTTDIQNLLNNPTNLQNKINEAIAVLENDQLQHTIQPSEKHQFRYNQPQTGEEKPESVCSVSMTETASISNSSIHYLSSVNNQSIKPYICSSPDICESISSQQTTQIETKTDENKISMPSKCSMRTVRLILNAPISKPILQAIIQQKCILNPICFQKIYVRCHKSYYHSKSTIVIYIHFINFTDDEYIECKNKLFNFDYNTRNIIGLMGNQFGIIHRVELIKEYKMVRVPIEYLSKMVKICLRCKWNEAENRKRVCKYCIAEEINDRNKIGEYYNNPKNKAIHKPYFQIENDLIELFKIEPHLIPCPIYKSQCKSIENKGKCNRNNCTFVHNKNEKDFGKKLLEIQKKASNRRYYKLMNQYQLNDYQIVALHFKYRKIISNYYEKYWKYNSKLINNEYNINLITKYLNKCRVKLHLIPLMYKSICRQDKCRIKQGKPCCFVHIYQDRIFGNILFKIKCNAKNKFETQSNGSINDEQTHEILFENIEEKKENIFNNKSSLTYAIEPYIEAVNDEQNAEIKELSEWSMHSTNISFKIETTVNKNNNNNTRNSKFDFELYIIYEDDKDAKITPWRTYVNILFACQYDVGLRTDNNNTQKRSKSCPACYFNVCNDNEHWKLHNDKMVLIPKNNCRFNDELQGVVVEKLQSNNNSNKTKYKVKLEKYGGTDFDITCWLKFAMIASYKFNKNNNYKKDLSSHFNNIYISYKPSAIHEKIRSVLNINNKIGESDICKIIFGIGNTMPILINDYKNVNVTFINKLFPRLNSSQIDAIYGSLKYNIHTIQGPPATGKTSICAHIAYLWWRLNMNKNRNIKIHGLVPTNKGSLVLAQKCMEMNHYTYTKNNTFKVLYFASDTYLVDKDMINQNILMGKICINVIAENALRQLNRYNNMDKYQKKGWKDKYIAKELKKADMIVTTFGNAKNKKLENIKFTHAICDEANQGSLDTFLGIIREDITQLTMAGDIQQLAPVIKSNNPLAKKSVYQDIISYLTNKTNKTNRYYTGLNTQYRSHPQIYGITRKLFYDNMEINHKMYEKRDYGNSNRNYGELFANPKHHIQWHIYGESQLDTSSLNRSKCNEYEAHIALKYIKKFIIKLGNKARDIAVLSDYRAQIEYMKQLLCNIKQININEILLCTTNEIEGSSKPIVIYMCCRSNNNGNIGFLNDNRRVNVALSRAEYGQIIIGDINTLQYNPIYNKIFKYHMERGAVVCENNSYNKWNKNQNNWIKKIETHISLINISNYNYAKLNKRNDYHICSGCGKVKLDKLFCGRSCNKVEFCQQCMNKYLSKYCKSAKKLTILSKIIIDKSEFFTSDASGIAIEFDTLLGKYLMDNNLIKHIRQQELNIKLCNVAMNLYYDIKQKYYKYIPKCFKILFQQLQYYNNKIDFNNNSNNDIKRALGIMRCKRNHLLEQNIMDTRFFQIVNKIRYNNTNLKKYYNTNTYYSFYLYKEFEQYQPTTVIVAYLQCCGYSTHISNRLRTRIGKELAKINNNNPGKYKPQDVIRFDKIKIKKFADELYSDQSTGIKNILSMVNNGKISDVFAWNCYVIELMQNAVINDTRGPYYHNLTHVNAIEAELTFGDKLRAAGFSYIGENELRARGFDRTPDYHLPKPWIINYNNKKVEISWLDFKNQYCSATDWNIDKLNQQAIKYNNKFGVGAFVFSLGFCKPPKGLQLNCYGLLAAVPLSKYDVEKFIQKRIDDKKSGINN